MPATFDDGPPNGAYNPAAWWRDFEDPVLNAVVRNTLDANLDIVEAAARLRQAQALARLARAPLFPQVDASATASYSSTPLSGSAFGDFGGGGLDRLENETVSIDAGAAYEVDLFGRNRNDLRARRADAVAAEADLRSVQLASAAQSISTYFELVDARRQIDLAQATTDLLGERVSQTEDRYRRGLVQSFELYQVRQQLRDAQASLPQRRAALDALEARLALLLAEYPGETRELLDTPLTPRLVFSDVPPGLPADLLLQRPDVFAAWQRLEAARFAIGARRAERFPAIRLSGSIGGQGEDIGDAVQFGSNWAASLAANIVAPIFDGGRISANIAAARATYDQRAAAYARTVLGAFGEVQSAIARYEEQRRRYRLIMAQLADAQASLDLQAQRFAAGVGGYIAYLDARLAVEQVQSSLSVAARDVAIARLGVHRALGGDWISDEGSAPSQAIDAGTSGEGGTMTQ